MPYLDMIKKQIADIEKKIESHEGNVSELKKDLERLKIAAFDEELRQDDNRQLLNG